MEYNKTFTIWITGLPLSGKSEIARIIEEELLEKGLFIELLDENNFDKDLLIEDNDYIKNSKRLGYLAKILNRNNVSTIISCVSPKKAVRNDIRKQIDNFVEVYIYNKKAILADYQNPDKAEIIINKEIFDSVSSAKQVIKTLEILNLVPKTEAKDYTDSQEKELIERLENLGYL